MVILLLYSASPCHSHFFFFNDTATTEIYTLSLHDALPISTPTAGLEFNMPPSRRERSGLARTNYATSARAKEEVLRSEEHTSELQSHLNLVCRLLLEKKKTDQ